MQDRRVPDRHAQGASANAVQVSCAVGGRTNGRASACAWRCSAVPASCAWLTRAFACIAVCVLYLAGGGAGLVCAARTPQRVCRRCRCSKRTSSKTVRCVRFAHGTRMRACGVALCACTRRCRVCTHSLPRTHTLFHAYTLSFTHTHSLPRIHTTHAHSLPRIYTLFHAYTLSSTHAAKSLVVVAVEGVEGNPFYPLYKKPKHYALASTRA